MLGEQVGFTYNNNNLDLHDFLHIYIKTLLDRLYSCMELYSINNMEVQGFQVIFYKVSYTNIVVPKVRYKIDFNSLGEHKDLINVSSVSKVGNTNLSQSMDLNKYGQLLDKYVSNSFC